MHRWCWVLLFLLACHRQTGLPVISVATQTTQISRRAEQLNALEAGLAEALASFDTWQQRALHLSFDLNPPFPRDTFRHAMMGCLTASDSYEVDPDSPKVQAAERLGVSCQVIALPALEEALKSSATPDRQAALNALQAMDRMRSTKNEIDGMLNRLPIVIQQTQENIASLRVELRQVENDLTRKKPEYLSEDYTQSQQQLALARQQIDDLEVFLERLQSTLPPRKTHIDQALHTTSRKIARLGESSDTP